jgi:hypothetical protein
VSISWILSNSSIDSAIDVPLMRSVISDDDATEMAQPVPLNLMSSIVSPASFTYNVNLSPHSGFTPSTTRSAPAISPKLRGSRLWSRITSR